MKRIEQMKKLKGKGFSYGSIGKLFKISRQRTHQLLSGYRCPSHHNNYLKLIYKLVFKRDKFICQKCGGKEILIHHIDKNDLNNKIENLICLCSDCHLDLHRPENFTTKGKHHTKETKQKMSEARKGEKHHFYGKKHSEKTRKKLSEANKGRKPYEMTEEIRRKMSEAQKKRFENPENHWNWQGRISKMKVYKNKIKISNSNPLKSFPLLTG